MMSKPRALVTGGAGFLGSHLCDALLGEGYSVVAVDNLLTGRQSNLEHLRNESRFEFRQFDINETYDCGRLDYVFHFASPASPVDYTIHGIETLKAGSLGTFHTLDVALKYHAKYLLSSTSECYGDPLEHPQKETYWGHVNPIGPRSVYDEAKRFSEAVTMAYHRYHRVDTRIARIFNTYGPRMQLNDGRVIPNFMKQALSSDDRISPRLELFWGGSRRSILKQAYGCRLSTSKKRFTKSGPRRSPLPRVAIFQTRTSSSETWQATSCSTCSRCSAVFNVNLTPMPKPGCATCTTPCTRSFIATVRTMISTAAPAGNGSVVST